MRTLALALVCLLPLAGLVTPRLVEASGTPVSLTAIDAAYVQDFDTLATSGTSSMLPTGWALAESGTNADTTYAAGASASSASTAPTWPSSASTSRRRAATTRSTASISRRSARAKISFAAGQAGDSVGLFSGGTFFLRNSNASGAADVTFGFGEEG